MEKQEISAGQRADSTAGGRAAQHALVLRRGPLCRQGHQADAELGQDQVQADLHRSTVELYYLGKLL